MVQLQPRLVCLLLLTPLLTRGRSCCTVWLCVFILIVIALVIVIVIVIFVVTYGFTSFVRPASYLRLDRTSLVGCFL